MKWRALTLIASLCSLLILGGCFFKSDLQQPVKDYLQSEYGIKKFEIVSASNNWFEGIDHEVVVKITKPYKTVIYLEATRDTYTITESNNDVFADIFKGAYIKQNPKVISLSNKLIQKYHLLRKSPTEYDKMKTNFYYYLNVHIQPQQREEFLTTFRDTQKLNTKQLLPQLERIEENQYFPYFPLGVVNFMYYFNVAKQPTVIPQAKQLFEDMKQSGVLTEGIYSVTVQMIESTDKMTSLGLDDRSTSVLFQVDSAGQVTELKP